MLELSWRTPPEWADAALATPLELLADHAHCELKAAATAQTLIARNPVWRELVGALTDMALEELAHFRRVTRLLFERGGDLLPPEPSPYAEGLLAAARRAADDPLLDRLLVSALIEARSLERFALLAERARDPELASLYRELLASEASHRALFQRLARERFGRERADRRLAALADAEGELVRCLPFAPRMHSGPPAAAVAGEMRGAAAGRGGRDR